MPSNPASLYRKVFPTAHRLLVERIINRRLSEAHGDVLVVGAGHDPYGYLLSQAKSVCRTDISDEYGNIDLVADVHDLPFEDGSFDAVVAIEVIEHLRSPQEAVAEIFRVLRPGGRIFVSIPFMYRVHGDPYDFTRFTAVGLKELFDAFDNISVQEVSGRLHVISDIITTAARPLAALRILNHLLALPGICTPSKDCPSGYWLEAAK